MIKPLITFEDALRVTKPIKIVYKPSEDSVMVYRDDDPDFDAQQAMDDRDALERDYDPQA